MGKILIISNSFQEQEMLLEVYSHHNTGQFTFETTASFGQPAHYWFQSQPQVLILTMPDDPALQNYYFEKLRSDVPVNLRIIFLCPAMTQGLMEASTLFERVRLIKTPVTGFFLYRAVTDVTTDYPPNEQQIHPRYLTDQQIRLHLVNGGSQVEAKMRNLSISGAYFEIEENTPTFKIEDTVRMTVELAGIRGYQFDARIVWRKAEVKVDGGVNTMGYGCSFLNKEAVYDSLLSQVAKAPPGLY